MTEDSRAVGDPTSAEENPTVQVTDQHPRPSSTERRRSLLAWRRGACAVALFAVVGAVGLAGGHVLGAVAGHGGAEHAQHQEHGDDDGGPVGRPLPGPVVPPAPGH